MIKRAKLRLATAPARCISLCVSVAMMAFAAASCTATRTIAPTTAAGVTHVEIKAGDVIRVLDKYRRHYTLKITALDTTTLTGEAQRLGTRRRPTNQPA